MQTRPDALFGIDDIPGHDERVHLSDYDKTIILSSGGKDSTAMLALLVERARAEGVMDRLVVVHNDLGTTRRGHTIEWPGVKELVAEHAAAYGLPLHITRRERGGFFQQLAERGMFPSSAARWCTSDQKTKTSMKLITRVVAELGELDRPARILYCVGLRAAESPGRRKKPVLELDRHYSSGVRQIWRYHPILRWSEEEVWDKVRASGLRSHFAYRHVPRLSCSFCVLASPDQLVTAAMLRPALAAELAEEETRLGHCFRADISMAQIIAKAEQTLELEAVS